MDRRFPEWKEKETTKKIYRIVSCAMCSGIIIGIMYSLLLIVSLKSINFGLIYVLVCILYGILMVPTIYGLSKVNKTEVERSIRPLMWDLRILFDKNIRQEKVIEILRNDDSDQIEYVGELNNEQHEEALSEITGDENEV